MSDPALDARRFAIACLFGLGLGFYYGFLRPLRPRHTGLSDALFLPALFYSWLYLGFGVCHGDIRLGYSMGILAGIILFELTAGRLLRPVFSGFWKIIGKIYGCIYVFLKKILKKCKKKQFFSFQDEKNSLQ